jgi:hypothetical protein
VDDSAKDEVRVGAAGTENDPAPVSLFRFLDAVAALAVVTNSSGMERHERMSRWYLQATATQHTVNIEPGHCSDSDSQPYKVALASSHCACTRHRSFAWKWGWLVLGLVMDRCKERVASQQVKIVKAGICYNQHSNTARSQHRRRTTPISPDARLSSCCALRRCVVVLTECVSPTPAGGDGNCEKSHSADTIARCR